MEKVLFIFLGIMGLVVVANAANTVTTGDTTVMLSAIDSDWDQGSADRVTSIVFHPGAANDVLVIKEEADAGPVIWTIKSGDGEERVIYMFGRKVHLYIDFSDCTLTAGATVTVNR